MWTFKTDKLCLLLTCSFSWWNGEKVTSKKSSARSISETTAGNLWPSLRRKQVSFTQGLLDLIKNPWKRDFLACIFNKQRRNPTTLGNYYWASCRNVRVTTITMCCSGIIFIKVPWLRSAFSYYAVFKNEEKLIMHRSEVSNTWYWYWGIDPGPSIGIGHWPWHPGSIGIGYCP